MGRSGWIVVIMFRRIDADQVVFFIYFWVLDVSITETGGWLRGIIRLVAYRKSVTME